MLRGGHLRLDAVVTGQAKRNAGFAEWFNLDGGGRCRHKEHPLTVKHLHRMDKCRAMVSGRGGNQGFRFIFIRQGEDFFAKFA